MRSAENEGRCRLIRLSIYFATCTAAAALTACGGGSDSPEPPASAPAPLALKCDDSMKSAFKPNADTTVTLVKAFKKGDALALSGDAASPAPLLAANDVCLVKLNVGPGNPGPADAPSTQPGIGLEVWLPMAANWNGRIRAHAWGGWKGDPRVSSLTQTASPYIGAQPVTGGNAQLATEQGYVTAIDDGGHSADGAGAPGNGNYGFLPDGSVNTATWADNSYRSTHMMSVVTKSLAQSFYLKPADYSYLDGCSGGGRAAYQSAQMFPEDFDGVLALAPSIDQTQFFPSRFWMNIAIQRDLGGVSLTNAQVGSVSAAAVTACDATVTGQHDGYISDENACTYDPTKDPAVLCVSDGGTNATAACVTRLQANVFNKAWYGPTPDGSVPSPEIDNGFSTYRAPNHLWWGNARGASLAAFAAPSGGLLGLISEQIAFNLQDPKYAEPSFRSSYGNGQGAWRSLSYGEFAEMLAAGKQLNEQFGNIDANNADLRPFRDKGKKMLTVTGLADTAEPAAQHVSYYTRTAAIVGGFSKQQEFHRLFLVPGMGHCSGSGSPTPGANPPLVTLEEMFGVLQNWVEKGVAPNTVTAVTPDKTASRPVCKYPDKVKYNGGDVKAASSFSCVPSSTP